MVRPPDPRLSRAVLIGTSDYEHQDELPLLPAVGNNLSDLRRALTDPDTGILGWDQCTVIDTPDSPASLLARLAAAVNQAEDLLLVYYAGHGERNQAGRDQLFLTVRGTTRRNLWGTGVPFESVRDIIESSSAQTRLLVLDCCYAGMAMGTMSGAGLDIQDVDVRGTSVIASSPRNERSLAPVGERYTTFTGEVIRLLQDGSPLPGTPLTVRQLFRSVSAALARRDLPRPKGNLGDTSGDLMLRREPAAPEPAPVAMTPPSPAPPTIPMAPTPNPPPEQLGLAPLPMDFLFPLPVPAFAPVSAGPPPSDTGLRSLDTAPPTSPQPLPPSAPPSPDDQLPRFYFLLEAWSRFCTMLLWTLLILLSSLGLSSVLDGMRGVTGTNLPLAVVGPALAGVCGLILYLRYRNLVRFGRTRPRLDDVRPRAALVLGRVGTVALWTAVLLLAVIVIGIAVDPGDAPSSIYLIAAEGIGGVTYLFIRRSRPLDAFHW
ncbi:caspase family protein [Crossiella sp. NPDC003009]